MVVGYCVTFPRAQFGVQVLYPQKPRPTADSQLQDDQLILVTTFPLSAEK